MKHSSRNFPYTLFDTIRNLSAIAPFLLASAGGQVQAINAHHPAAPSTSIVTVSIASEQSKIHMILKELQQRGTTLHNFQAHLVVQVHHLRTDEKDMNIGHIWYQQSKGKTRFDIRFDMLVVDGAIAKRHADHDIVFDGHWLIDRNGSAKIFRKIEIAPPGKQFNPLRLGQGPIPIPIGQKPSDVEKEFHIQLLKSKKMPPHTVGLKLIPRDKSAFTFVEVDFWINTRIWLPVEIIRTDPDGTPTTATLSKIVVNRTMRHDFHLSPPGSGWTVVVKHYQDR
ncbi:MAG: LolA family protein [Phycisphaerae bacterium]